MDSIFSFIHRSLILSLCYIVQVTEVRPKVTLVVRMAAAVANYDYIMDWEFQTDGLIRSKVSGDNST